MTMNRQLTGFRRAAVCALESALARWTDTVIAVSENIDIPTISGFRCMNAAQISDFAQSQYRIKDPSSSIALNFTRRFLANYPI